MTGRRAKQAKIIVSGWLKKSSPIYWWLMKRKLRAAYLSRKVIFIHVPKAAGTSVTRALYRAGIGHCTYMEIEQCIGRIAMAELNKFTVVRDPMERLYSAYRFAVKGGGSHGAIRGRRIYTTPEFRTFDSFIMEWLSVRDVSKLNKIFWPQTRFFDGPGGVSDLDEIFHITELDRLEQWLESRLSEPIRINHLNYVDKTQNKVSLSSQAVESVFEIYEADYKKLYFPKVLSGKLFCTV